MIDDPICDMPKPLAEACVLMAERFALMSWADAYRVAAAMLPELCEELARAKAPGNTESAEPMGLCMITIALVRSSAIKRRIQAEALVAAPNQDPRLHQPQGTA